jgi:hypothetical protein
LVVVLKVGAVGVVDSGSVVVVFGLSVENGGETEFNAFIKANGTVSIMFRSVSVMVIVCGTI